MTSEVNPKRKKLRHLEYYDLTVTMDGLHDDAKKGKTFNNLMDLISSENNILLAYRSIKRNNGSHTPGVDNKTIKDLEKLSSKKLIDMVRRKLKMYKPASVKRVEIPKMNGKTRPLGIPTIADRLVQQCILQILEPICEAKFHYNSHGFRPNRSAEHAIASCYKMMNLQKLYHVIDVDIKGFFDNVNHSKLIKQMWHLGIRDKKLIMVIKKILTAEIVMPNGTRVKPDKGTPQGGILSPLLSNIVLNEFDWWIHSQWEGFPTKFDYQGRITSSGIVDRSNVYRALKRTNLKEMKIVRYADDFKVFCRNRTDAEKTYIAIKKWLLDNLKLEVSEEKSQIVDVRKRYSEFLGFKMRVELKGNKYTVVSHMSDKALEKTRTRLSDMIKKLQRPADKITLFKQVAQYNLFVWGIHNYYDIATHISVDCAKLGRLADTMMNNRLQQNLKKQGTLSNGYLKKRYGKSKSIRFVYDLPVTPISFIRTRSPMLHRPKVNQYTSEGRQLIHKKLQLVNMTVLRQLVNAIHLQSSRSVEYMDNRISLYTAQKGICPVLKRELDFDEIHCHHIIPLNTGGTDKYRNLVIIHNAVHKLIHATNQEKIDEYLNTLKLDKSQIAQVNNYRLKVGNEKI